MLKYKRQVVVELALLIFYIILIILRLSNGMMRGMYADDPLPF